MRLNREISIWAMKNMKVKVNSFKGIIRNWKHEIYDRKLAQTRAGVIFRDLIAPDATGKGKPFFQQRRPSNMRNVNKFICLQTKNVTQLSNTYHLPDINLPSVNPTWLNLRKPHKNPENTIFQEMRARLLRQLCRGIQSPRQKSREVRSLQNAAKLRSQETKATKKKLFQMPHMRVPPTNLPNCRRQNPKRWNRP